MAQLIQFDEFVLTCYFPDGVKLSMFEINDIQALCDDMLNDEYYFDESDCWVYENVLSDFRK